MGAGKVSGYPGVSKFITQSGQTRRESEMYPPFPTPTTCHSPFCSEGSFSCDTKSRHRGHDIEFQRHLPPWNLRRSDAATSGSLSRFLCHGIELSYDEVSHFFAGVKSKCRIVTTRQQGPVRRTWTVVFHSLRVFFVCGDNGTPSLSQNN